MRRLLAKCILVGACALGPATAMAGGGTATVAPGDYKGAPVLDAGGSYQSAVFSVRKSGAQRTIVATEEYDGIYYPDVGKCDDELLPLTADVVNVARLRGADTGTARKAHRTRITGSDNVIGLRRADGWCSPATATPSRSGAVVRRSATAATPNVLDLRPRRRR